jgi:Na+/H+ antiporter NhaC
MMWLITWAAAVCAAGAPVDHFSIEETRGYQIGDLPVSLVIQARDASDELVPAFCGSAAVTGVDGVSRVEFDRGVATVDRAPLAGGEVVVESDSAAGRWSPDRQLPGWLSILPPLFAILLALIFRQALIALFAGVWLGALFIHGFNPLTALWRCFDTYLPATLADSDSAKVVLFTMALGGMVGIISASGGTKALVDVIARRARGRRAGMLTAWFSGLIVFFDDYANCLLVGNTVRPFSDRLGISREKLAYIVDSTAAPISTIALISTWVGYQVGLFDKVEELGGDGYSHFLAALPYSFYPLFTLVFVFVLAVTLRDFGPMLRAERRATHDGHLVRPGGQPLMDRELTELSEHGHSDRPHWAGAVIPVASVILIVMFGLYWSGATSPDTPDGAGLRTVIGNADSYAVLLWASFGGGIIAAAVVLLRGDMPFGKTLDAWVAGVKSMVMAVLILVLAWALGAMCKDHLSTGGWILSIFEPTPRILPLLTFVVCAVIALATGSSFSTMAIVIPIAAPMAWQLTGDAGLSAGEIESIRYGTLAAVLSGAVFGDHCSPISDTTIMSSMSCASDHIDHVRTQAPYAFICAGAAGVLGFLPAGWGVSPLFTLPLGVAVLVGVIFVLGKRVDDPVA